MKKSMIVLALALAGCGSDGSSSGGGSAGDPGVLPLVLSTPNSFSLLPVGPVRDDTYQYTWNCGSKQANLSVAGVKGDALRIEIWDEGGAVVHDNWYQGGLDGVIDTITNPDGVAGNWRLRFTFVNITSLVGVDIQADVLGTPDDIVIAGAYDLQSDYEYQAGWTSGPARATLSSTLTQGTVRIRMWDADGTLVLDRTNFTTLVGDTSGNSNHGVAGTWTIRIDIDAVATAGAITIDHP